MIRFEKAKVEIGPKKIVSDLAEANFWGVRWGGNFFGILLLILRILSF